MIQKETDCTGFTLPVDSCKMYWSKISLRYLSYVSYSLEMILATESIALFVDMMVLLKTYIPSDMMGVGLLTF